LVASYRAVTYWSPDEPSSLDVLARRLAELRARIAKLRGELMGKAEDDAQEESRKRGEELIEALKRDVEEQRKKGK